MLYEKVLSRGSSNAASVMAEAPDVDEQLAAESLMEQSGQGGGSSDVPDGNFVRFGSQTEPPEMDKYEKLVLDQLVSGEDDEVRKQSFELLSSPSSILNVEEEFAAAVAADKQQQQQQQQSTISRGSAMMSSDPLCSSSYGPESMLYTCQQANISTLNLYRPTFESDFAADQLRQAEMATRQVIQQTGQPIDRLPRMEFIESMETNRRNPVMTTCQKPDSNKACTQMAKSPPSTGAVETGGNGNDSPPTQFLHETQFLQFGLFPARLVERALSTQLTVKNEALNQMLSLVKQAPCTQLSALASPAHMSSFVQHFLLRLLEHPNFKVTLQALEIVQTLILRLKHQLLANLSHLVSAVVKRLGKPLKFNRFPIMIQ